MNHHLSTVLLSIKPKYIREIENGSKLYEYRKVIPSNEFKFIFLYVSSPIKKLVGYIEVEKTFSNTPEEIWNITRKDSGIAYEDYLKYFENKRNAYAFKIKKFYKLKNEIKYDKIKEVISIPQSFRYIDSKVIIKMLSENDYLEYNKRVK